jgi:uncharacterized protein (TIGR02001 family)
MSSPLARGVATFWKHQICGASTHLVRTLSGLPHPSDGPIQHAVKGAQQGKAATPSRGTEAAIPCTDTTLKKFHSLTGDDMKKHTLTLIATAATLTALHGTARAEDPPASPFSFNVGAISDYRYRGISQSRLKPALQGGIDYAHASGFYLGTWASTIQWIKDAGGNANLEIDLYGGYKGDIVKDSSSFDVGVLTYQYPSNNLKPKAETTEIYGAVTFGPVTAKYSHSVSNLFGFADSKSSGYLDISATFDLGNGLALAPHVGHQSVAHGGNFSYTDYSLTLTKDFSGLAVSAAVIGTDAKKIGGVPVYASPAGKNLGQSGLVVGVKYSF